MAKLWKKGRGKLGPFEPLHGTWVADAESPMGPMKCTRKFELILGCNYLLLSARWEFGGSSGAYEEMAVIGAGDDKQVSFWSFTSDGKRSNGTIADVTDLHAEAVGFEADMPAGRARMAYWPDEDGGISWVVESKTKKGWRRFVLHHYKKLP